MTKVFYPLVSVAVLLLIFCPNISRAEGKGASAQGSFQQILNDEVRTNKELGILASISAPGISVDWSGAAGGIARGDDQLLDPNQSFRIASVTKVFIAAAIFRLIEEGKIGLYDPIQAYITPETARLLESGGYHPRLILVQHLLAHTSGLYDYAMDKSFGSAVLANGSKRWTRREEIEVAMTKGKPVGLPGQRYSYSDTGYVILGEIIENASGLSMAEYVRRALSYQRLGLTATYFESLERAPAATLNRAHQYWGDVDITAFDPSMDLYGGGGIVSTTRDLNTFMRALLTGRLFEHRNTLPASLTAVAAEDTGVHPRANMISTVALGKRTCWGHEGYWGTVSLYCPDIDVAVSLTVNASLDDSHRNVLAIERVLLDRFAMVIFAKVGGTQRPRQADYRH